MRTYARTIAVALAMGALGFFTVVGLMTVLLSPQIDSFAPKNSADAAGWVQAIGSIIAILASYHLGARQAADLQRQDAERRAKLNAKQKSIGTLVQTSSDSALRVLRRILQGRRHDGVVFIIPGAHKLLDQALATLRTVSITEVDPPEHMQHVTGIISSLTHAKDAMTSFQAALEPPRRTRVYDLGSLEAEKEAACDSFHHSVMFYAMSVHDHLASLGFPSKERILVHGYVDAPSPESAED